MRSDRAQNKRKQRAYAESMLLNAIMLGGIDEALRVRHELNNILIASTTNVHIMQAIRPDENVNYFEDYGNVDKKQIVLNVFKGASDAALGTLIAMSENNDLYLLPSMFGVYTKLVEEHYGVVVVDVDSVVKLDDHLRELITNKIQNDLDAKVVLHEHINKNILGGVVLYANNRVLDCSLLTSLERIKSELISAHHYDE